MEKLRQGPMLHLEVKGVDDDDDDDHDDAESRPILGSTQPPGQRVPGATFWR
jgi:hypothetical protein